MRSRLPAVIWQAAEKAKEDLTPRVPIIPPTQLLVTTNCVGGIRDGARASPFVG